MKQTAKTILMGYQGFAEGTIPLFDFHIHTDWTDGAHSIQEMHQSAIAYGLKHMLFSEHVRASSESWYFDFAEQVRACDKQQCHALVGMETKIMNFSGGLDATPAMIATCDLVMASVHRFPGEEGIKDPQSGQFAAGTQYDDPVMTEYNLANLILENPQVDILGHPFGMSYKRFKQAPAQHLIVQLIKKAAQTGVAFEINSRYHPDVWELVRLCQKYDAPISLGSNAHAKDEIGKIVDQLRLGVMCETN